MAFDYSGLKTVADTLIGDFGREVVLRRQGTTFSDPSKPWGATDPAAVDVQSITTIGVFLNLSRGVFTATTSGAGLSSVEEKTTRCLVIAAAALPEEMGRDWQVDDGSRRYEITASSPVRPGGTLLYYDLELKL